MFDVCIQLKMQNVLKVRGHKKFIWYLFWSASTKKSDGTEGFLMTGSVDGCSVLPETQFADTCLRANTTQVLSVGGFPPTMEAAEERSEFDITPPLGAPNLIFLQGYLLKSFREGDTSARQRV